MTHGEMPMFKVALSARRDLEPIDRIESRNGSHL